MVQVEEIVQVEEKEENKLEKDDAPLTTTTKKENPFEEAARHAKEAGNTMYATGDYEGCLEQWRSALLSVKEIYDGGFFDGEATRLTEVRDFSRQLKPSLTTLPIPHAS